MPGLGMKGLRVGSSRHHDCLMAGMITVSCIFFAFIAAGFFMEMTTVASAPLGYQDAGGFHFGRPAAPHAMAWEFENPS